MKKIILIITIAIFLFVSGCEKNNTKILTCTGMNKGNNMNAYSKIKYIFRNDKLVGSNLEVVFKDITVDNIASIWETAKTQFTEQNKPTEEVGYKRTVKSDDKNYTFTVIIEIDFEKISKETMEKYEVQYTSDLTYNEVKEETISDGTFTCK